MGVGVGAAADRHRRRHFGVAQARERAGDRAEHERQRDGRPGIGGGRMPRQHENAGADDAADPERDEMSRGKHAPQRPRAVAVSLSEFAQQLGGGFTGPNICHREVISSAELVRRVLERPALRNRFVR
jgi:hypothetical protein